MHISCQKIIYLFSFININFIEQVTSEKEKKYAPVVQTASGKVKGIIEEAGKEGKRVHIYEGIRYGKAERFHKPTPAPSWSGVYSATAAQHICPQMKLNSTIFDYYFFKADNADQTLTSSEDCLYLNVFRPAEDVAAPEKRAVMVWIHGGLFLFGSSYTYNAKHIASLGDVIVVTVNYRLGALGFMIGFTPEYPANYALYDIALALQWVQLNAGHFGGDAQRVTLFGESSGAMAIGALILSPLTKGLFRRAILQSGAPNSFGGSQLFFANNKKRRMLANKIDCLSMLGTFEEVQTCMEEEELDVLQAAINSMAMTGGQFFGPTYPTEFLPDSPVKSLKYGRFNTEIDLLYGVNRDEGNYLYLIYPHFSPYSRLTVTTAMVRSAISKILSFISPQLAKKSDQVFEWYAKGLTQADQAKLKKTVASFYADIFLVCPLMFFGQQFAKFANSSNRVFSYGLAQQLSGGTDWCPPKLGICHAMDLSFVFGKPIEDFASGNYSQEDRQLSIDMISSWTNFAKTGDPGMMGTVKWEEAFAKENEGLKSQQMMVLNVNNYQNLQGYFKSPCDDFWRLKIFV